MADYARKIGYDPYGHRETFIFDEDQIERQRIEENKAWLSGDADEILNYFTQGNVYDIPNEPIYSRNRSQYFWSKSAREPNVRRTHSGIGRAAVETMTAVVGIPTFVAGDPSDEGRLKEIVDATRIRTIISQRYLPLTMGLGRGCFKVSLFPGDGYPTIEYYEADRCRMRYVGERLAKAEFFDWYEKGEDRFLLVESRFVEDGSSVADFHLYRMRDGKNGEEVSLDTLDETSFLHRMEYPGYPRILAVPCMFFDDPIHPHMGRSVLQGKGGLIDQIDETISVHGLVIRYSTPMEYIPRDLLERDPHNPEKVKEPSTYFRQFVITEAPTTNDPANGTDRIQVTQPKMEVDQYIKTTEKLMYIFMTGFISPSTMGLVPDRDNPNLSREHEKETIFTRNTIVEASMHELSELMGMAMDLAYGTAEGRHKVSVRFAEFANPSLENEIGVLGGAWSQGQISTKLYVRTLWRDRLTDAEMAAEEEALEKYRAMSLFAPVAYEGDNSDGRRKIEIPDSISVPGRGEGGGDPEAGKDELPVGA